MEQSSREFIKRDQNGFYYYDRSDSLSRYIYIRSIDISNILGVPRTGTDLEKVYIDLYSCFELCIENDKNPSLFMYLKEKFSDATHDHRIVPTDLANADDNWSGLI